jgi:septal ring factor EnvC (AmiA/AmiB activator)
MLAMNDLKRLTNGLAVVKHGLDELDTSIRSELTACHQLSQQIASRAKQNQDLQGQVADVCGEVCATEEECEELAAILQCCHEQMGLASARKKQLMVGTGVTSNCGQQLARTLATAAVFYRFKSWYGRRRWWS